MFGTNFCHVGLRSVGGKRLRAALLASTALVAAGSPAVAQDATWLNAPGSGNFNTGANWTPATVPTGTAFFDTSGTTALSIAASASLGGWTFNPGASAYSFTNGQTLQFTGAGIVVNGGSATIANSGNVSFRNTSTAGNAAITNSGLLRFFETSTAGSAAIINNSDLYFSVSSTAGSATIASNFNLTFQNTSTAGSAAITNNFNMYFTDTSTAGSASITNNRDLSFNDTSTAGSAAITNNSALYFANTSTAGSAAITNGASGTTDFSYSTGPLGDNKLSAGSIAGGGNFRLGQNELTVGGNNLSTNVTGVIADGGFGGGTGGSLVKTGTGTLTLSGINTYTGATTVNGGTLAISGSIASSTITNNATLAYIGTATAGSAAIANNANGNNANGTLNFNDTSTAGSAAIFSQGSLNFNDTSTAGSASASITNNYNLTFNGSATAGSASITNNNNASLIFYGAATAGSAAITNGGSLNFGNTSTAGSATITNNDHMRFFNTATAGSATIANNGTLYVIDNSTAGNAAITNGASANTDFAQSTGPLGDNKLSAGSIGGGGVFWLGQNELTVGGNNLSTNVTGVIADGGLFFPTTGGSLVKTGAGTLTLSGINTYTGGTTVTGGTLEISGSIASSTIANNATLAYIGTATAGSATITNNSGGTLDFNNTSTAASASITNNNSLNFRSTSTAGSAAITNNSGLNFFDTSTAGSAAITNGASGNTDFSFSTGPAGDNKLSAGSLNGGGNFRLGTNELTVGGNNLSTEVSGAISGTGGALIKTGTGTMTLSGVNTYTGATTVDGGVLAVNGSILTSSGVTVNSGGTLAGTGTVGATTIASGGTLAPGNSIGTINVSGNLTFASGGVYAVEFSPTAADRSNVTGAATLTGATVQAIALPGSFRSQTYTILNAGGGFGGTQFAGLNVAGSSLSPGARNPHLTYDANNVFLVLDPGTIQLPAGASGNQAGVAGGINRAVLGGATPPAGFDVLLNLEGTRLTNALTQVSGETAVGAQRSAFGAASMFMGQMTDPFNAGRSDAATSGGASSFAAEADAYAASRSGRASEAYGAIVKAMPPTRFEQRWSVWAGAYGGAQTTDGNAAIGTGTTTSRIYGGIGGADYRLSPDAVVGFALAGGGTNFNVANGGSGRADLFQAGAFARYNPGAFYLAGALAYGWQDVTTDRTVTVAGIDRLQARFNANTYAGRVEGGYRFVTPWMNLTPYAAGQVTSFELPAYAESVLSGANTFALSYGAKTVTASRSELGLRTDRSWTLDNAILTLRGRAAWAHDFNPDRAVAATFQTLPGASFVVNGAAQAKDAALTTASAEVAWRNGFSLGATFEGEFSNISRSYAGKGIVRYVW